MIKFFKSRAINSNKGISIILAIIIIIMLGLAGSVFAYLMASGSIVSRSNLLSAETKYAAKSGVEITLWEIEQHGDGSSFSGTQPSDCPAIPVWPSGVTTGTLGPSYSYLSGNLQGNNSQTTVNYTPTFCSVMSVISSGSSQGNCDLYVITSNGFAGGTEREVTAEVADGTSCTPPKSSGVIYVESELPNSN